MYDFAITKSCDRYGVGRTALKTEYGEHWKNTKYPIHSIAYFEGRETADEAQAYSELAQKYREEFESSPDYDDTQEANARSEADHIAELIGAALARQIGGENIEGPQHADGGLAKEMLPKPADERNSRAI